MEIYDLGYFPLKFIEKAKRKKKQQEKALLPRTRDQPMLCKPKEEIFSFCKEAEMNTHKWLYNLLLKYKMN